MFLSKHSSNPCNTFGKNFYKTASLMETNLQNSLTIGVVARRSQIHPETLRVWEKRYDMISPLRTDSGQRLYSESDILKVLFLYGSDHCSPNALSDEFIREIYRRTDGKRAVIVFECRDVEHAQ